MAGESELDLAIEALRKLQGHLFRLQEDEQTKVRGQLQRERKYWCGLMAQMCQIAANFANDEEANRLDELEKLLDQISGVRAKITDPDSAEGRAEIRRLARERSGP